MKKILKPVFYIATACLAGMFGCKEGKEVNMEQIHQLQDSVTKTIPGVTAIDIKVVQQKDLKVIIGDPTLYAQTAEAQHAAATKAGEQAMLVFGDENAIKTGVLIITKESRQSAWDTDPADGIKVDMKLDSLKEHDEVLLKMLINLKR